jgi:hypothetical protein
MESVNVAFFEIFEARRCGAAVEGAEGAFARLM